MARGNLTALLLLGACVGPPPAVAPAPTPPSVAVPSPSAVAPAPRPTFHRDDFRDADSLPPGAVRRFGSKRLHGSDRIALLGNGWLVEGPRIWKPDGHYARWTQGNLLGHRADEVAYYHDGTLHWVNPEGTPLRSFKPDCGRSTPWLSPDGLHAFCHVGGGSDGADRTRVLDAVTGARRSELPLEAYGFGYTRTAAGDRWVSEQNDGGSERLVAYDLETGKEQWHLERTDTRALALSPEADVLYRIDDAGALHAHAAGDGELLWRFQLPPWKLYAPLTVSPDGRRLAFEMQRVRPDQEALVRVGVFEVATRTVSVVAEGSPRQLDFTSRELAIEAEQELRVVDIETGEVRSAPPRPYRALAAATVYGELVVSLSQDGVMQTWDRATGEPRLELAVGDSLDEVAFLPSRRVGVFTHWPMTYRVLDVTTGKTRCTRDAEDVDTVIHLGGAEVVLVERATDFVDGAFVSRVTAVGDDCAVVAQRTLSGRIIEASMGPGDTVELLMANGTIEKDPTEVWLLRWSGMSVPPKEVMRSKPEAWEPPARWQTPVDDGEPYLTRPNGKRVRVDEAVAFNPPAPVAVVRDAEYRDELTEVFVFDRATGRIRKTWVWPPELDFDASGARVDAEGQWLTVVDDATVLLYRLAP